jgi:hypothetical protein
MSEWYEQLLEMQLARNRDVWAELREHDVEDDMCLRLGFLYLASGKSEAKRVVAFLRAETDYEVRARARPEDGAWVVIGTTQPTPVSLALLDDWVEWMIAAGAAEGPCAFDGWAAQLVGTEADPWLRP